MNHNILREIFGLASLATAYGVLLSARPLEDFLEARFGIGLWFIWGIAIPFAFGALGYIAIKRTLRYPIILLASAPLLAYVAIFASAAIRSAPQDHIGFVATAAIIAVHVWSAAFGAVTARLI